MTKVFFIPGPVPSSKNSRMMTRTGLFIGSKATQKYRKASQPFWAMYKDEFRITLEKMTKPIIIGMHFVRATERKWDFINPAQTVQDLMTKAGWIDDDNVEEILPVPLQIEGHTWSYDKDKPGVYIAVLESFCTEIEKPIQMKPFLNVYEIDLVERLKLEDEFFAQGFLMSYSGLNRLLYSPGAFYQHYVLKQREDTVDKGMAEGKLIHCMLLTPERFEDEFVVLPTSFPSDNPKRVMERLHAHLAEAYPSIQDTNETILPYLENMQNALLDILKDENLHQTLKTDQQRLDRMLTDKNMEYLDFLFKRNGRTVVDKDMVSFAERLKESFMNNPQMRDLMGMNDLPTCKVYNEVEVVMMNEEYEFGLRGILDNLVIDHVAKVIRINDLKKSSKPLSQFAETIEYYKYWIQAAMYKMILDNIKKDTYGVDYPVEFRFLVIDPYMHMAPFKISDKTMDLYVDMTKAELEKANQHFKIKDFSLPHSVLISDQREYTI